MKLVLAITASAALAAVLAVPASATQDWSTFKTPSGHIHCEYGASRLRCDVENPQFKLPKHDCHGVGDYGFAFAITRNGPGKGICASDAVQTTTHVLHYGQVWVRGGIICHSHTTGLRCRNGQGHKMYLSPQHVTLG